MYKITVSDDKSISNVTGAMVYFCQNNTVFTKENLTKEFSDCRVDEVIKVVNGKNITYIYVDSFCYCIIEEDRECKIYKRHAFNFFNKKWHLLNDCGWSSDILVHNTDIEVSWIYFDEKMYKIAIFSLNGVTAVNFPRKNIRQKYRRRECYGNPILETFYPSKKFVDKDGRPLWISTKSGFFDFDTINCDYAVVLSVFNTKKHFNEDMKNPRFTKKDFRNMTMDIAGKSMDYKI